MRKPQITFVRWYWIVEVHSWKRYYILYLNIMYDWNEQFSETFSLVMNMKETFSLENFRKFQKFQKLSPLSLYPFLHRPCFCEKILFVFIIFFLKSLEFELDKTTDITFQLSLKNQYFQYGGRKSQRGI